MKHVLTMANLKLKPSLFIPRPSVHVHWAYVVWVQLCAQDVVSGGVHFHFPRIPKWGITCGHSLHCRVACRKAQHGWDIQGLVLGFWWGPGGGPPGSSWVLHFKSPGKLVSEGKIHTITPSLYGLSFDHVLTFMLFF